MSSLWKKEASITRCLRRKNGGTQSVGKVRNNIIIRSFRELFRADKKMFLLSYGLTLMQGLTGVLPIVTIQLLFDAVADLGKVGGGIRAMGCLALFIGARILKHLISLATNYLYEKYDLTAGMAMRDHVNRKVIGVAAVHFEETDFLKDVNKAYRGTDSIRRFIDVWMVVLFLYIPEVVTVLVYLYKASPYLLMLLLPMIIPSVIVLRLQEKECADKEEACANLSRKIGIYNHHLFDIRSIIETKVAGYGEMLTQKACACIDEKAECEYRYNRSKNRLDTLEKVTILLGRAMMFIILVICTAKGMVSIGVFAALLSSMEELFAIVEDILSVIAEGVSESLGKIRNYFALMDFPADDGERKADCREAINEIAFENVSFRYPGKEQDTLRNLTITINRGDHIAVVGENGAGKTTFIKLLCGLYTCTDGSVRINGRDIRDWPQDVLADWFTAVFQKFGKYAMTVKENILLASPENDVQYGRILREVGDEVAKLAPDTVLSREFGGVDISGGQWQRIAICRARYKDGEVYLLDEPTSAIDPNEEKKLYEYFEAMTRTKTAVIVTHRMSAARLASKILVLNKGRVCGFGTHEELLKSCREYSRLWNSQARMYA